MALVSRHLQRVRVRGEKLKRSLNSFSADHGASSHTTRMSNNAEAFLGPLALQVPVVCDRHKRSHFGAWRDNPHRRAAVGERG